MNDQQVVAFRLGEELFAVPIHEVKEIIRLSTITKVPLTKGYVKGIINLRGKVITVVNLAKFLEITSSDVGGEDNRIIILEHESITQGFIVDSVSEVLDLSNDAIISSDLTEQKQSYLSRVAKVGDQLLLLLDVKALFV